MPPPLSPGLKIMRLHRNQLPSLSREIVAAIVTANDIEVTAQREVALDVEAVLRTYVDAADEVNERARDLVQQRGLPQGEFSRIKRLAAEQRGIKLGDDALDYVLEQILEMLMHSNNVEEVFAEDHVLRRRMRPFIVKNAGADRDIEAEVRSKLKHVEEGTRVWEIEYQRMKEDIKRRRGM